MSYFKLFKTWSFGLPTCSGLDRQQSIHEETNGGYAVRATIGMRVSNAAGIQL